MLGDSLLLSKKQELITYLVRLSWRSKDDDMSKRGFRCLNHLFYYDDLISMDFDELKELPPALLMTIADHAEAKGITANTKSKKLLRLARRKCRERDFGDVDVTAEPKRRRRKKIDEEEIVEEDKNIEFEEKVRQRRKRKRKSK